MFIQQITSRLMKKTRLTEKSWQKKMNQNRKFICAFWRRGNDDHSNESNETWFWFWKKTSKFGEKTNGPFEKINAKLANNINKHTVKKFWMNNEQSHVWRVPNLRNDDYVWHGIMKKKTFEHIAIQCSQKKNQI